MGGAGGVGGFVAHAHTFAGLTLVSRVLGLARDMICSRVFGASGLWSAWVVAFVVPNVFRRLFGEGALSAAFIPEYTRLSDSDPQTAAKLASLTLAGTTLLLTGLVILAELVLWILGALTPLGESAPDVIRFTMIMLPYMPLVCAAALLGGMLQAHGRFAPSAAAPIVLNVCMIIAVWFAASANNAPPLDTAVALSVSVVVAGVLQAAWVLFALHRHVRWTRAVSDARVAARRMIFRMGPVLLGLGALQISTLLDALIAGWPNIVGDTIPIPGNPIAYPLDETAAGLIYYAQRLYQFPLGVFAIAIATAVFPTLSRHTDDQAQFTSILSRGIRLSLFIALPASVGLILVRTELINVIYAGGEFTPDAAHRVAFILLAYAPAVWAYSLTQVLTRAFYAKGDTITPMRVGLFAIALNLALNLSLIWFFREAGLALATSISAIVQALILARLASKRLAPGLAAVTLPSAASSAMLTGAMALAVFGVSFIEWPTEGAAFASRLARLLVLTAIGGGVYVLLARLTNRPELRWLISRSA